MNQNACQKEINKKKKKERKQTVIRYRRPYRHRRGELVNIYNFAYTGREIKLTL